MSQKDVGNKVPIYKLKKHEKTNPSFQKSENRGNPNGLIGESLRPIGESLRPIGEASVEFYGSLN